ncbi:MFS transporter [Arthrobacter sp. NPDC090010]|uniref:MFS transporter n=1 Tax=Arthrobacter sp. NPDC090010 TaxID=3363942 RepID=UPI003823ED0B
MSTETSDPAEASVGPAASPFVGDAIIGRPQRWYFLPALVLAWFGGGITNGAIVGASLPKLLALIDEGAKEANLAIISMVGGVVILVTTPLFGRLSDRTRARMGMRKPWYLGGIVTGTLGCVVMAVSANIPVLALGWVIVQLGYGAVAMANHTLLADQVPGRIRARVSAAVGVSSGIATVAASAIVAALPIEQSWTWFVVPAAIGLVTVLPVTVAYQDAVRSAPAPRLGGRDILSTYWISPRAHPDFAWAWVSRFFMTMSIFTIALFLFYLIMDTLHLSAAEVGGVQTAALSFFFLGNIVATVFFGWLSDRLGRRKIIIWVSGLASAGGVVALMFSADTTGFFVAMIILGFAGGAYSAVDVALMTEVLPSRDDAGKDLGIVALSYLLPQIISPLIGAGLVTLGGGSYGPLYVFSMICSAVAGLTIIPVRGVR